MRVSLDDDIRKELQGSIRLIGVNCSDAKKATQRLQHLGVDQVRRRDHLASSKDKIGQRFGCRPRQQKINERGRVDNDHQS